MGLLPQSSGRSPHWLTNVAAKSVGLEDGWWDARPRNLEGRRKLTSAATIAVPVDTKAMEC